MSAEPALHLVEDPELARLKRANAALQRDLENAEVDLKGKRRIIQNLRDELAEKRRRDPLYPDAVKVFDYWRTKCRPKARTFSEDREKAVLARLKDRAHDDPNQPAYTPRYICEAILGAVVDPIRMNGKVYDDLELICRTGRKLEDFHDRYERAKGKGT